MKNILTFLIVLIVQNFLFGQTDSLSIIKNGKEKCFKDSIKAVEDSKIQFQYFIYLEPLASIKFQPYKELERNLAKYKIKFSGDYFGTDIDKGYETNCYQKHINIETEKKFGKKFIQKLIRNSVKEYQINNPQKIFTNDSKLYFSNKEIYIYISYQYKKLHEKFFDSFKYPENFTGEKFGHFSYVTLNIDEKGKIVHFISITNNLKENENQEISKNFEEQIKSFLQKNILSPITYFDKPVKGIIKLVFYY